MREQQTHLCCSQTMPCRDPTSFLPFWRMVTRLVTQQPGCGYPAVQWVFGHEVKIAFNFRPPSAPILVRHRARAWRKSICADSSGRNHQMRNASVNCGSQQVEVSIIISAQAAANSCTPG
jgi:hypothetical protein